MRKQIAVRLNVFKYLHKRSLGEATYSETDEIKQYFSNKRLKESYPDMSESYISYRNIKINSGVIESKEYLRKKDFHMYKYPVLRRMVDFDLYPSEDIKVEMKNDIDFFEDREVDRVCGISSPCNTM